MNARVSIREHQRSDMDAYVAWQTDPLIGQHLSWLPKSIEEARASFEDLMSQQSDPKRVRYFFAVVYTESQEVVGDVGFTADNNLRGDCGWFISSKFQGRGYATDAVKLLVDSAFNSYGMKELIASCARSNAASIRIMEKCGFKLQRNNEERVWYAKSCEVT